MAIVSYDYYFSTYMGEPVADADWLSISKRAERLIKQITHGRVTEDTFAVLPPALQTAVKEAICAEIEYISLMGKDVTVTGDTSSGWTVGKVTVQAGARVAASGGASMVCPAAIAALEQTGLLNPAVPVLGEPPQVGWPWGVV